MSTELYLLIVVAIVLAWAGGYKFGKAIGREQGRIDAEGWFPFEKEKQS